MNILSPEFPGRVAFMQRTDAVDMLPTVRIPGMVPIILPGECLNVRPDLGILCFHVKSYLNDAIDTGRKVELRKARQGKTPLA